MWKRKVYLDCGHLDHVVSVPLRGLDMWKLFGFPEGHRRYSFSPLAGIRYVETSFPIVKAALACPATVSVPLRGLDMWKPRHLKHKLGAESRSDFGGPLKKPHFRLWVKDKLKLIKR